MNCDPLCSLITALEVLKSYFSLIAQWGRFRIYKNSSKWHHIFIILATILYPKKLCINYVETGSKWPNVPN